MKSIFKAMGGTDRREASYFTPNPELSDMEHEQIGRYGRLKQTYLREHRPVLYNTMFLDGSLYRHLAGTDQIYSEHMDRIVAQMAEREGVIETSKAWAQLEWAVRMNSIWLTEVVCA